MALLKNINRLRLWDMIRSLDLYSGIAEGLADLPASDTLTIGKRQLTVPANINQLCDSICYGQRLYITRDEPNDFGIIIRVIAGYYYPSYTRSDWSEPGAKLMIRDIMNCKAKDIYPVAMHLVRLIGELVVRESKLLHRDSTSMERAAGIERLNVFNELNAVDFLRDSMKITTDEVLLTSYNECLIRFMNAKELADYQDRYYKLMKEQTELKTKKK